MKLTRVSQNCRGFSVSTNLEIEMFEFSANHGATLTMAGDGGEIELNRTVTVFDDLREDFRYVQINTRFLINGYHLWSPPRARSQRTAARCTAPFQRPDEDDLLAMHAFVNSCTASYIRTHQRNLLCLLLLTTTTRRSL